MRKPWIAILGTVLFFATVAAQDEEAEKPWTNSLDLSAVWNGGNAESSSFGFKNAFEYEKDRNQLNFVLASTRAESATFNRSLAGTPTDPQVIEDKQTETTAENYNAKVEYNRSFATKSYWFTGLKWERNEFAGVNNRYEASAGYGNTWIDTKRRKLSTSYGLQYTKEDPINEIPGVDDSYLGARFHWKFFLKIGKYAELSDDFLMVANLDETEDFRVDWNIGLSAPISDRTAIKLGLQLLYDNEPSFDLISGTLTDENGTPRSVSVPFQLDELDTVFTASVVITF